MKIHDQHVHCYYSEDSEQQLEPYIEKALSLDLSYFAVSDHLDLDFVTDGIDWIFDAKKEREELDNLQKKYTSITLLQGIEVGFKDSALNRLYDVVNTHNFDFINLSLHDYAHIDFYFPEVCKNYGIKEANTLYLEQLNRAINEFKNYDVVAHIDFCFKACYLADKNSKFSDYEPLIVEIMKSIIKNDKCLEINLKVQEMINDEHTKYVLNLYKKLGGKNLTLSSDAHDVKRLCNNFDHYIELIKDAGFDHLNYFIKRQRFELAI